MVTLVFHNLSHTVNKMQMKLVLPRSRNVIIGSPPSHASVVAVRENDILCLFIMRLFLMMIFCIILEEAKTAKYPELGLAWKCYKSLSCIHVFTEGTIKTKLMSELYDI